MTEEDRKEETETRAQEGLGPNAKEAPPETDPGTDREEEQNGPEAQVENPADSRSETTEEAGPEEPPLTFGDAMSAAYKFLTSMKTAIATLVILGIASFLGTLVPQIPLGGGADVQKLYESRPVLAKFYELLGMFDIYHAPWYLALLFFLMLAIVFCTIPRIKKTWNRTMTPKFFGNENFYHKLKNNASFELKGDAEAAREVLEEALRSQRYSVRFHSERHHILADSAKFKWAAFASVFFHVSFIVVAFGIIFGLLFGFNGNLEILEGDTGNVKEGNFTQVRAEGAFFRGHNDFGIKVTAFNVIYGPEGGPRGFVSHVRLYDASDNYVKSTQVRMNRPLDWNGYRIFQQTYGFAPDIKITASDGAVLVDGRTKFFFAQSQAYGQGYLDYPGLRNLTFQMAVVPTTEAGNQGKPFIDMQVLQGEDTPQQIFQGRVPEGDSVTIPGGFVFKFKKMSEFTGLNVVYNPGISIIYGGFTLGSLAILFSLYLHERRIWGLIVPEGKRTKVVVGGLSTRNMVQFTKEFDQLKAYLESAAKGMRS